MLICGDCSARNNDGESFCSNCGAYLVWQGEQGETRPSATEKPGADPGPAMKTVLLPKLPPPPDHAPSHPSVHGPGSKQGPAPRAGKDASRPFPVPRVTLMAGGSREEDAPGAVKAGKPAVPVTDGSTGPGEVKPGKRTTPPPAAAHPPGNEEPPAPGELICGRCGTGNKPDRNFCRRCAASLKEAAVVPPPPWWRRLASKRAKPALPAGSRPKRRRRRFPVRLVSFLAVLGVLGGAAYAGKDGIAGGVERVQDILFSGNERAIKATASSSRPDRGAELAIDTFKITSWAAGVTGNTADQYLDITFEREIRLTYIYVTGGPDSERRPRSVEIIALQADGERPIKTFALMDVPARQDFYVGADRVSSVRFKILESSGPAEAPVAVAEIQFSSRR
ncbi:MAG: hypothetical protein JWQ56_1654 [Pseudarthrobacter sp.]|nr:hypothetical protein [Pseudarthrobacter sp.]